MDKGKRRYAIRQTRVKQFETITCEGRAYVYTKPNVFRERNYDGGVLISERRDDLDHYTNDCAITVRAACSFVTALMMHRVS